MQYTTAQQRPSALIASIGAALPETILTNFDLEKMVDTSNEWIVSRTGIEERRIANEKEFPSTMGLAAAQEALQRRGVGPESIDLVLVATMTPDYLCPSTACLIQGGLGATNAAAVDIQAACSGFLYGLQFARCCIESGVYRRILLVSAEKNSAFIDYQDRNTCVLFGDGAGACIIESSLVHDNRAPLSLEVVSVDLGADGSLAELFVIPGGGSRVPSSEKTVSEKLHSFQMNGKEVFRHAVRRMELSAKSSLEAAGLEEHQLRWLIPHQANMRIIDALAKRFDIPQERVATTITKYANTSAATIPITLYDVLQKKKIEESDLLLLVAFGGGLTWGSAILRSTRDQRAPVLINKSEL